MLENLQVGAEAVAENEAKKQHHGLGEAKPNTNGEDVLGGNLLHRNAFANCYGKGIERKPDGKYHNCNECHGVLLSGSVD